MTAKDVRQILYNRFTDDAAEEKTAVVVAPPAKAAPAATPDDNAARTRQVITLLNALGGRLVSSEKERAELKTSVQNLQGRMERAEMTETAIRQQQAKMLQDFQGQMQKMQKAVQLAERIEEALAQQARLARRMEQITEDRSQLIRKVERIEEAVIETKEAIRTGALVVSNGSPAPWIANQNAFLTSPALRRTALSIFALAAIAGAGFGVRAYYEGTRTESIDIESVATAAPPTSALPEMGQTTPVEIEAQLAEAFGDVVNTDPEQMDTANQYPANNPFSAAPAPDAFNMTDQERLEKFESNPDELAAALNDIEPSTVRPENLEAAIEKPASINIPPPPVAKKTTPAPRPAPAARAADAADIDSFLDQQATPGDLRSRIAADPNLPAVVKEIEATAFEGVPEAQHDLAAIYTAGHGGVTPDFTKAATWFREAAMNGVANARYNLGVLYHQGLGVPQNLDTAISWYRAAAQMKHPEAQYNLGIAYIEGVGTPYDPEQAAFYFESAAKGGILEAAYNLGLIHENGLLGTPRPDDALYWYKIAADRGSPEAQTAMNQLIKTMSYTREKVESVYKSREALYGLIPQTPIPAADNQKKSEARTDKRASRPAEPPPPAPIRKASAEIPVLPLDAPPAQAMPVALSAPMPLDAAEPVPVDPSSTLFDAGTIAQIQEQLARLSLYPGPADGRMNPLTEDAIRAYQKVHNLSRDGRASEALLVHMLSRGITPGGGTVTTDRGIEGLTDMGSREE